MGIRQLIGVIFKIGLISITVLIYEKYIQQQYKKDLTFNQTNLLWFFVSHN